MILKRKCIATNEIKDVNDMIRIVKTKDGNFFVDSSEKGRGAYISKNKELIGLMMQKKLLNKTFKQTIPNEVYQELAQKMEEENEE